MRLFIRKSIGGILIRFLKLTTFLLLLLLLLVSTGIKPAMAVGEIRIVGSSTVFPFSALVAEWFSQKTGLRSPIVESTGTGGGFKAFCSGAGANTPAIVNASRTMSKSEVARCKTNGVSVLEIIVGYDGITIAGNNDGSKLSLSKKDIYYALAKVIFDKNKNGNKVDNPNVSWKDVNPRLPDIPIKFYGPPPSSGTRDSFSTLVMEAGAFKDHTMLLIRKKYKDLFKTLARDIREDGVYVETLENDNLIVQKLKGDDTALGIFGFSYYDKNRDILYAIKIDGTYPSTETIANGKYSISRPLYIYVKKEHLATVEGLKDYLLEYTSDDAGGEFGYLSEKGLIPLPDDVRADNRKKLLQSLR